MGNSETTLALLPEDDGMLLITLHYYDEIKSIPRGSERPKLEASELDMAKQLIGTMEKDFVPQDYKDGYQERLRGLVEKKIQGQEVVAPESSRKIYIVDLMEALKASCKRTRAQKTKKQEGRMNKACWMGMEWRRIYLRTGARALCS
jgi:DNA end-binding protein Ku